MSEALPDLDIRMRPASLRDLSSIVEIERQSFEEPWDEKAFRLCLQREQITVAECVEGIAAFMIIEGWHVRSVVEVAVHPNFRRRKVATRLLWRAMNSLEPSQVIRFEVRESNVPMQLLLSKSLPFHYVETVPNAFEGETPENGYLFEYRNYRGGRVPWIPSAPPAGRLVPNVTW